MIAKLQRLASWLLRRNPFTVSGRLLFLATLFCFVAILDITLVGLFSYLIWFLIISFVCGLLFRQKTKLEVKWITYQHIGQKFTLSFLCTNLGRLPAYDLQFRFSRIPRGFRLIDESVELAALETDSNALIEFRCEAIERGVFELPEIQIVSRFPFGLFRFFSRHAVAKTIMIAPRCDRDLRLRIQTNSTRNSAIAFGRQKSRSLEYIGSREYQPGVPVRRWDYSSWARMGKPAVREFSEGQASSAVLLYDDSKARADQFERVLELVASAVDAITSEERSIQLIAASSLHGERSAPDAPTSNREPLMQLLAQEEGSFEVLDWPQIGERILNETPPDATLIAFTSDDAVLQSVSALCAQHDRHLIIHTTSQQERSHENRELVT